MSSLQSSQEGPERNRSAEVALHHRSKFFGAKPKPSGNKRVLKDPRPTFALSSPEGIAWLERKESRAAETKQQKESRQRQAETKRVVSRMLKDAEEPGISEEERERIRKAAQEIIEQYLPASQRRIFATSTRKVAQAKLKAAKQQKKPPDEEPKTTRSGRTTRPPRRFIEDPDT